MPGYVVDSILPLEEELRRFRAAVGGDSVAALSGGATNRDVLVKNFVHALATADTAQLIRMQLSPREFAWLVYPESPYTKPPYRQPPGLIWTQIQNPSASGLTRLLRRLGGQRIDYAGYSCGDKPDRQGPNRMWTGCDVRLSAPGKPIRRHRLFGSIIERNGQFKFVSYLNDF